MELGIYDHEEYAKAMAWTEKYCKPREAADRNRPEKAKTREEKDQDWEFVVKMTLIARDLMTGNPKLREMGFQEEDWTNMNAMWARIFTDAMSGDKAAQKMILDYGGFNPEFMLREKESKAKIRAMKEESERRTMYGDNVDGQRGDADDIQIYLPDNRRDDLK